ncbi:MAG: DUF2139 domain-containing protein [Nitrososphaeria archaeon]|jgi:hypothetical protein
MEYNLLTRLHRFPPRYGPEWGSGGVFGLRYYKGTLYFNLSFEGEAHFVDAERDKVYSYNLIGPSPVSGGDTYNAVDTVDDQIYFGGWIHAPAVYDRSGEKRAISFVNKYSHVHEYDTKEKKVRLVWKDSIHDSTEWAGEVSEIVYNPVDDKLLLARADGHKNLGIFSLDRKSGETQLISQDPGVKGTLFLDTACFDTSCIGNFTGLQCLELSSNKWVKQKIEDLSEISVDDGSCFRPFVGSMTSAYARLFVFIKGGVIVGNPLDYNRETMKFIRLFDFGYSGYSPSRTVALPFGGGVLTAFNSFTHGFVNPMNPEEVKEAEVVNTIIGPSVLVYLSPPMARIVGSLGARVTSIESFGDKILLGTSTTANLSRFYATPIDAGYRDVLTLDSSLLLSNQPPVSYSIPGSRIANLNWGGIPLFGYKNSKMVFKASKDNRLTVYEYDIGLPVQKAERDVRQIKAGKNVINLSDYDRILSFKLEEEDLEAMIYLHLK